MEKLYIATLVHGSKELVIQADSEEEARKKAEKYFQISGKYSVLVWEADKTHYSGVFIAHM